MKYSKVLLLGAAAALAFVACSDLAVDDSVLDNYPAGFTYSGYLAANQDLVDMQVMDQVAIANAQFEANYSDTVTDFTTFKTADETAFAADTAQMIAIGEKFGGYAVGYLENSENMVAKVVTYLKKFNLYSTQNDLEGLAQLSLDTSAIVEQYLVYGQKEGRAFRLCSETETSLVKKGDCQSDDAGTYFAHLYCADAATKVVYCIDCNAATETCAEVVETPTSSSSAAVTPASSAASDSTATAAGDSTVVATDTTAVESSASTTPADSTVTE